MRGKKILKIEETTTTQWLYAELKEYVDKILICDPFRNRLLREGPKTDKIDDSKLVQLLKANLVKEVYHSTDKFLCLSRVVSGYEDLFKASVRLMNQRYALLRACGKKKGPFVVFGNDLMGFVGQVRTKDSMRVFVIFKKHTLNKTHNFL